MLFRVNPDDYHLSTAKNPDWAVCDTAARNSHEELPNCGRADSVWIILCAQNDTLLVKEYEKQCKSDAYDSRLYHRFAIEGDGVEQPLRDHLRFSHEDGISPVSADFRHGLSP